MSRIQLFETFTTIKKLDSEIGALLCEKEGDVDFLAQITETRKINDKCHEALLQLDEALTPKVTGAHVYLTGLLHLLVYSSYSTQFAFHYFFYTVLFH